MVEMTFDNRIAKLTDMIADPNHPPREATRLAVIQKRKDDSDYFAQLEAERVDEEQRLQREEALKKFDKDPVAQAASITMQAFWRGLLARRAAGPLRAAHRRRKMEEATEKEREKQERLKEERIAAARVAAEEEAVAREVKRKEEVSIVEAQKAAAAAIQKAKVDRPPSNPTVHSLH